MRDLRQLVRERLGPLGLAPEREREIFAELADHLEDRVEAVVRCGAGAEQAFVAALHEGSDWESLNREIRRAEENDMNERTRNLWLPGLVTLGVSASVLMVMVRLGLRPFFWWVDPGMPVPFYVPWLVLLPVFGAVGAYWSKRVGGGWRARLLAGSFPAAAMLALLVVTFLLAFLIDSHVPALRKMWSLVIYVVGWVLVPGAALLLGTLPFLQNSERKPA